MDEYLIAGLELRGLLQDSQDGGEITWWAAQPPSFIRMVISRVDWWYQEFHRSGSHYTQIHTQYSYLQVTRFPLVLSRRHQVWSSRNSFRPSNAVFASRNFVLTVTQNETYPESNDYRLIWWIFLYHGSIDNFLSLYEFDLYWNQIKFKETEKKIKNTWNNLTLFFLDFNYYFFQSLKVKNRKLSKVFFKQSFFQFLFI